MFDLAIKDGFLFVVVPSDPDPIKKRKMLRSIRKAAQIEGRIRTYTEFSPRGEVLVFRAKLSPLMAS